MFGENRDRVEGTAGIECAFGDDALALAEEAGQDTLIVDRNTVFAVGDLEMHAEVTVPFLTSPPSLMRVPGSACFSMTSLGELKNTIES